MMDANSGMSILEPYHGNGFSTINIALKFENFVHDLNLRQFKHIKHLRPFMQNIEPRKKM